MKIIAGIVGGLILAALAAVLVSLSGGSNPEKAGGAGAIAFFVMWVAGIVIAVTAPNAGKAWRRLLILCAICAFMLPLSGIIFTGSHVASTLDRGGQHAGAAATGAAIGGTLISGVLGFVGFFVGVIFLIIGLLVGRDKQVVYVQVPTPPKHDA